VKTHKIVRERGNAPQLRSVTPGAAKTLENQFGERHAGRSATKLKSMATPPLMLLVALIICCAAAPIPAQAQTPSYSLTLLGGLGGYAWANAINDSGEIVGLAANADAEEAVTWSGTTPVSLGSLSSSGDAGAFAVNNSGVAVGYACTADDDTFNAASFKAGTPSILQSIGTGFFNYAYGINNSGVAVGYSTSSGDPGNVPVEWSGTTASALGILPSNTSGAAMAINNSGMAVGYQYDYDGSGIDGAVKWSGTTPFALQSLSNSAASEALAINNNGEAVGYATDAAGIQYAVEWSGTTLSKIPSLSGTAWEATAINSSGAIVGYSTEGPYGAFLSESGTTFNLDSLIAATDGVTDITPYGINDEGDIVGRGVYDGQFVPVLLTPAAVPEPATWALVSLCIPALLAFRRGRCQSPILISSAKTASK
jgi:hypothetical protein